LFNAATRAVSIPESSLVTVGERAESGYPLLKYQSGRAVLMAPSDLINKEKREERR